MNYTQMIKNANSTLHDKLHSMEIVLIAHVLEPRGHNSSIQQNCSETEHFSIEEFDEIYGGIISAGFFIRKIFFTETEFIKDVLNNLSEYSFSLVFNLSRNGSGMNKKTIVPAICNLLNIKYTSSSAGQCALARNKMLSASLLTANGVSCPLSSLSNVDITKVFPPNTTVIVKPNSESASQGIDDNSIMLIEDFKRCAKDENLLIQKFIAGYECEVPIISSEGKIYSFPPVGINFTQNSNTGILSYEASHNNAYNFYSFNDTCSSDVCKKIQKDAVKTFQIMDLENYGRIDFRIDMKTNQHYVTDISTTPYITKHSSFAFATSKIGGKYSDIFKLIIAAALQNNDI